MKFEIDIDHEQLIEFTKQSAPNFKQYSAFFCTLHDFKRFAALGAAHEREAEREACALVAEDYWFYSGREVFSINIAVREIAEKIRARSE